MFTEKEIYSQLQLIYDRLRIIRRNSLLELDADVLPSHIDFDGFGTVFYKSLRFFILNSTLLIVISGKMLEIPNTLDVRKSLSFKSD